MDTFPIEAFHLLVFTVPGFFMVWSYRKTSGSKGISDFEYLMFSIFWGLLLVIFQGKILEQEKFTAVLGNPYAAAVFFSLMGMMFGWGAGKVRFETRGVKREVKEVWVLVKKKFF